MRKFIAPLLIMCIFVLSLAGCAKNEEPPAMVVPIPEQQPVGETVIPPETLPSESDIDLGDESVKPDSTPAQTVIEPVAEITPLPEDFTVNDIFDRMWITIRKVDGLTVAVYPQGESEPKTLDVFNNKSGEWAHTEKRTRTSLDGSEYTVDIAQYVILDNPGHYTSYEKRTTTRADSEEVLMSYAEGRNYVNAQNTVLSLLTLEPFFTYQDSNVVIDNQEYYVLSASVQGVSFECYVNMQTFELHYIKSSAPAEDDAEAENVECVITYGPVEISVPTWSTEAEEELGKEYSHEYAGFFPVSTLKPVTADDMFVAVENVTIRLGDSAQSLFDTKFQSFEISSLDVTQVTVKDQVAVAAKSTDLLQPHEVALCSLSGAYDPATAYDWVHREEYVFAIYNPTNEPIEIRNGIVGALFFEGKFMGTISTENLLYEDCRALFGGATSGAVFESYVMASLWDKPGYDILFCQSLFGNMLLIQQDDGPDLISTMLAESQSVE